MDYKEIEKYLKDFKFSRAKYNLALLDLEESEINIDNKNIINDDIKLLKSKIAKFKIPLLRVQNFLEVLTDQEKQFIVYKYFENKNYKEIALIIGLSFNHMPRLKTNILKKIAKTL